MDGRWKRAWVACLGALSIAACSDDNSKGVTGDEVATMELSIDGTGLASGGSASVSPGSLAVGEVGARGELTVINTGKADLKISAITITSDPPNVFSLASDARTLAPLSSGPYVVVPPDAPDGELSLKAQIVVTRPASGVVPVGTIVIKSNSVTGGVRHAEVTYTVRLESNPPRIQVIPRRVDFETVQQGKTVQKSINVLNQGGEDLVIDQFYLSGHPGYQIAIGTQTFPVSPASSTEGITLDTPLTIAPGGSTTIGTIYVATGPEKAEGMLVLKSNDPAAAAGTPVELRANVGGPCIQVNPHKVDFGGKLVGRAARVDVEVTSCGDKALSIEEVVMLPDSSSEFSLSLESFGSAGATGSLGPADPPVVLQPNEKATFTAVYNPEDISPFDASAQPIRDTGKIRIKSNSFNAEVTVDVTGFGVDKECPTAVIVVQEGEEVIPQTKLHLIGSQSYAATGSIQQYKWRVQQPPGSASRFFPTDTTADPTFETNIVGTYRFELTVTDSSGTDSCVPAVAQVAVISNEAIHIELLWDTPNDPDQSDEGPVAGADLDLHFAHPFASGPDLDLDGSPDKWFHDLFDCFWSNDHPNWGSLDPSIDDNPGLDRDDTDGAGPENVNLNQPENVCYEVGVHYWADHGFGKSFGTLRMYLYGNLVFEVSDVELVAHDMWWVTSLCWPPAGTVPEAKHVCAGTVQACDSPADCTGGRACGLRIAPNYVNPNFPTP